MVKIVKIVIDSDKNNKHGLYGCGDERAGVNSVFSWQSVLCKVTSCLRPSVSEEHPQGC